MSGFNLYKRRSRHTASSINLTTAPKYVLPVSPKITFNPSSKSPTLTSNLSPLYKFTEEGFALDKLETHKTQEQSFLSLEKRGSTEYSPKKQAAESSSILTRQASTGIFSSDLSPSKKSFSKDGRSSHIYTFDNKNGFSLKSSIQNPLPSLPKRNFTLAYLDGPATQTNITQEDIYASQSRLSLSPERKPVSPPNPLSNLVKFEDGKIPFHLALNAEARRKMIEEVKKKPSERADLGSIMELRDKKIPEATAEFLGKLTDVETKKIEGDFRSRSPQRNTIYHLHALDKKTKTRVMAKLQKQLTQVSRYLNS